MTRQNKSTKKAIILALRQEYKFNCIAASGQRPFKTQEDWDPANYILNKLAINSKIKIKWHNIDQ